MHRYLRPVDLGPAVPSLAQVIRVSVAPRDRSLPSCPMSDPLTGHSPLPLSERCGSPEWLLGRHSPRTRTKRCCLRWVAAVLTSARLALASAPEQARAYGASRLSLLVRGRSVRRSRERHLLWARTRSLSATKDRASSGINRRAVHRARGAPLTSEAAYDLPAYTQSERAVKYPGEPLPRELADLHKARPGEWAQVDTRH